MSCCDSELVVNGTTIVLPLKIITGLDFCWRFQLRDPSQPKIDNPDFDDTLPVEGINTPTIYPPLDLNNYKMAMDIRAGNTADAPLIYRADTVIGNITVNDPALGWVKVFIGRADTGDENGIAKYAAKCATYSFIVDPNQPGVKNYELYAAPVEIKESNTDAP